ncbi:uncharacterized protein LOC130511199 [Raphanus sativus]|uniref:Uncharacterized protein LOC130511199 n=1 Tax=Raphanus sativus TaxID=3726 RepID=A0A9W3DJY1_RAPSA|nr:uncharacterized protein LOC130511199 [Raphanus sativus]
MEFDIDDMLGTVTHRGIEANPEQVRVIQVIPSPRNVKEVQRLTGRMAALSSAVLVREEGRKQHPIYYVSKSLLDAETRYSHLENLAIALVNAALKLRPYFQAHRIVVVTSFPIKAVLHKPEVSGRLAKWGIELGEYDVIFRPAIAIKSQVLADFVAEFSPAILPALEQEVKLRNSEGEKVEWTLYVDGSSNVRGAGMGLVLTSPTGESASRAVCCNFKSTNNEAEYEAVIAGLTLAKQMGVEDIQVFSDSQLIISQVQGDYQAKDPSMIRYLSVAKRLLDMFRHCNLTHIPREHNSQADALANLGSALETTSHMSIPLRVLQWPATEKEMESEEVSVVDEGETWMTPIINYLRYDTLPEDRDESRKIRRQAVRYCFSEWKLYRRSFLGTYLRCLTPREATRILEELHEGECGSHSSGRSLVLRARRAGYYWPTMAGSPSNKPSCVANTRSTRRSPTFHQRISNP